MLQQFLDLFGRDSDDIISKGVFLLWLCPLSPSLALSVWLLSRVDGAEVVYTWARVYDLCDPLHLELSGIALPVRPVRGAVCHKEDQRFSLAWKDVPLWEWTLGFISPFEIECIKVRHLKAKTQWSPIQSQVQKHWDELCYYDIVFAGWDGGQRKINLQTRQALKFLLVSSPRAHAFFSRILIF